jgi:general secretion pathway protein A
MYKQHFGFQELPFTISPDPRFFFMSEQHREALAHLFYGMNTDGGFVLLTGEVGTGKTTVSRCLLEQVPENVNIAFILNPKMTAIELLATICDELRIPYPVGCSSIKIFVDAINSFLLNTYAQGKKTVLIIEEAQNLSPDVLEQIRLLTNLETNQQKLLQIIMIGQPEFRDILSRPEMSQLSQRITARYHIGPLSKEDVAAYVNHRLSVAGATQIIFISAALGKLYRLSRGIPRLINIICDRALLGAYVQGNFRVDKKTLVKAAQEVLGKSGSMQKENLKWVIAGLVFIICGTALAATFYHQKTRMFFFTTNSTNEEEGRKTESRKSDSLEWPSGQLIKKSKELAYQSLFQEWGIPYAIKEPDDACVYVQSKGLRCLEKNGNLKTLNTLNKPAVLKLIENHGREYFAALKEIKGQRAVLVLGSETRTVEVPEIEERWSGDYLLLWRPPKHYSGAVYPGSQGLIVKWLDSQLSVILGMTDNLHPGDIYHDDLVNRVKKFQIGEGLEPDGVVGSQTFICILNKLGSSEPLLTR